MKSEHFDIPAHDYFTSKNIFTGSLKSFNYKLTPDESIVKGVIWVGKLCCEKSKIATEQDFPLDQQVTQNILVWLEQQYAEFSTQES